MATWLQATYGHLYAGPLWPLGQKPLIRTWIHVTYGHLYTGHLWPFWYRALMVTWIQATYGNLYTGHLCHLYTGQLLPFGYRLLITTGIQVTYGHLWQLVYRPLMSTWIQVTYAVRSVDQQADKQKSPCTPACFIDHLLITQSGSLHYPTTPIIKLCTELEGPADCVLVFHL